MTAPSIPVSSHYEEKVVATFAQENQIIELTLPANDGPEGGMSKLAAKVYTLVKPFDSSLLATQLEAPFVENYRLVRRLENVHVKSSSDELLELHYTTHQNHIARLKYINLYKQSFSFLEDTLVVNVLVLPKETCK